MLPNSNRVEARMYITPSTRIISANKENTATFSPNAIWTIRRTTTNKVNWQTRKPIEGARRLYISYMSYIILFNAKDEVVYSNRPEWKPKQSPTGRKYALVLDDDEYLFLEGYRSPSNKWAGRKNFRNPPLWAAGIWVCKTLETCVHAVTLLMTCVDATLPNPHFLPPPQARTLRRLDTHILRRPH